MDSMDNKGEVIIYQTDDGLTHIDVQMEDETVWLTQAQLCELFQSSKSNISKHILEEGNNQLCGLSEQLPLIEGIIVQVTTI